eukprot:gnl/TRDRNA2_/TRDRNA2_176958_c0_seq1.p1 gnl/TRDRNA2_/TRDRNA2_176958_c0~~gnl/TRDRNA2_/TRDRNA2_176958_c0_seq1.p1  ORF type:complete len:902 (+),score=244.71 gnl/TRDRNA2_/TRDRNA2_176958_c0_seq1:152-2707(+)
MIDEKVCDAISGSPDALAPWYSSMANDDTKGAKTRDAAMHFALAEDRLCDFEDYEGAIRAAGDALSSFREAGDQAGIADTLRLLVFAYKSKAADLESTSGGKASSKEALAEAAGIIRSEHAAFKKVDDKRGQAAMLLSLAELEMGLEEETIGEEVAGDRNERALKHAELALVSFREVEDKRMEAIAHYVMANLQVKRSQSDEALTAIEESLELFKQCSSGTMYDDRWKARALHTKAKAHFEGCDVPSALTAAKAALSLWRKCESHRNVAIELLQISRWMTRNWKAKEALHMAKESLKIFQQMDYGHGWQVRALDNLVECLLVNNSKKDALKVAKEALARVKPENKLELIRTMATMCQAYLGNDSVDEAIEVAEQALELCRETGDKQLEALLLHRLSDCYVEQQDFFQSAEKLQSAQTISKELHDTFDECAQLHGLIETYIHEGKEEEAAAKAAEQRELYRQRGEPVGEIAALQTVACCKMALGEMDEAAALAKESQSMARDCGNRKLEGTAVQLLAELREGQGELKEALELAITVPSFYKQVGDMVSTVQALNLVAKLNLKLERPEEAVQVANEAKLAAKKAAVHEVQVAASQSSCDANIALSEMLGAAKNVDMKAVRAAHRHILKDAKDAVAYAKQGGNTLLGHARATLAQAYCYVGRTPDGLKEAEKAQELFKKEQDKKGEAYALIVIASALHASSEKEKALTTVNKALEMARAVEDAELEQNALDLLQRMQGTASQPVQGQAQLEAEAEEQDMTPVASMPAAPAKSPGLDRSMVQKMVWEICANAIGDLEDAGFGVDSPLMESGLDSLSSLSFRNELVKKSGMQLPAALMFDYPTAQAIIDHIVESSR